MAMVGPGRLELPTLRLSGVRSNQTELRARTLTANRYGQSARPHQAKRPGAAQAWMPDKSRMEEMRRRRRSGRLLRDLGAALSNYPETNHRA